MQTQVSRINRKGGDVLGVSDYKVSRSVRINSNQ